MFNEIFVQLLQKKGITALDLSRDISVPKTIVYEWKSGKRQPSVENLLKLAEYFDVSVTYLMTGSDGPEIASPQSSGVQAEDDAEKELLLMLRAAKKISVDDHDELVENFRKNLEIYLGAQKNRKNGN